MSETVVIGDATLIHGDCREVLPTLPRVDAVITDPPYGIGVDRTMAAQSGTQYGRAAAPKRTYESTGWDDVAPSEDLLSMVREAGQWVALFGGNYFLLPPSSCWLVWDKLNGTNQFADCELAWTNWPKAVRRIQWQWNGMIRQGNEDRCHPTQKPLQVMAWVLGLCPKADTVLDPFMGSGTTGVACIQMGRKFTGIERERKYFDIACERISRAQAQGQMFEPEPIKAEQAALL